MTHIYDSKICLLCGHPIKQKCSERSVPGCYGCRGNWRCHYDSCPESQYGLDKEDIKGILSERAKKLREQN